MTPKKITDYAYGISVLLLALTGFGQMPVFKRYYIADIPGLGWLARFYITHAIHYITAAIFLGIIGYRATVYLAKKEGEPLCRRTFQGGHPFRNHFLRIHSRYQEFARVQIP